MRPFPPTVGKLVRKASVFVPPLRWMIAERDRLIAERDSLLAEKAVLVEQRGRLAAEHEQAIAELDRLKQLQQHADRLQALAPQFVPPGHFYSPIPMLEDLRSDEARIFAPRRRIPGVDLDETGQLALLEELAVHYRAMDFPERQEARRRYWFENSAYSYSDAIFLHCMIRHVQPKRIIEVGSGHSSCMTLDTNEEHFGNRIQCTFIEPYPALLLGLLRPGDAERIEVVPKRVQEVDLERFAALEAGDILFIDSTHVVKAGSDVNYLYFEVLPVLKPGVFIQIHDIFAGFEYPRGWILEGRQWSEAYLLRALLMFNPCYRLELFNTFLETFHREWFEREMPLCLRNPGGSIWLRRTAAPLPRTT